MLGLKIRKNKNPHRGKFDEGYAKEKAPNLCGVMIAYFHHAEKENGMKYRDINRAAKLISYLLWIPNDARSWFVAAMLRVYLTDKDRMVLSITVLRSLKFNQFMAVTDKVYEELRSEAYDAIF